MVAEFSIDFLTGVAIAVGMVLVFVTLDVLFSRRKED